MGFLVPDRAPSLRQSGPAGKQPLRPYVPYGTANRKNDDDDDDEFVAGEISSRYPKKNWNDNSRTEADIESVI